MNGLVARVFSHSSKSLRFFVVLKLPTANQYRMSVSRILGTLISWITVSVNAIGFTSNLNLDNRKNRSKEVQLLIGLSNTLGKLLSKLVVSSRMQEQRAEL